MPDAVWQGMKPSIRNRYAILQQTDKTPEELQKELYADVTKTMSPEQLKDLNTIQQLSAQISSMTSPWYLHFMRYDPGQDLKKLKCPVLALNGKKDIQVDAVMNLTAIQKRITGNGNKNVTVKAYPNLNHLFQTCEKGTLTEYGQLEETINPEVLKDIIEWIRKTISLLIIYFASAHFSISHSFLSNSCKYLKNLQELARKRIIFVDPI